MCQLMKGIPILILMNVFESSLCAILFNSIFSTSLAWPLAPLLPGVSDVLLRHQGTKTEIWLGY